MKKKIILTIIAFIIFMIIGTNIVNAANAEISATKYDVKVGESVKINVSFTAAAWNIAISGDGITDAKYASQTDDLSEKTTTKSFDLDTSKEGSYTIKMTGDITDENGKTTKINETKTIKVSAAISPNTNNTENGNSTSNTGNTSTATTQKSTEARLKNLGIKPNDFSGFKRDNTTYNVEVPNGLEEVEIYAEKLDSKATVKGTGKVSLKEGKNTFNVVVTAEDGKTTKTYTLNIIRKTEEEENKSEARLSNLGIRPKQYDFSGFKRNTKEYSVDVPNDVEEVEIYATAISAKAKISGTGKVTLKEGKNTFNVGVTAEDGTKQTYTLIITRKDIPTTNNETTNETDEGTSSTEEQKKEPEKTDIDEDNKKLGLSKLTIKDNSISPKFNANTYEYTIGLTQDLASIEIEAEANNKDATVEIVGNENLKDGENIITILVKNAKTEDVATYQIIVNKNVVKQREIKASWFKPSTWGKEEKIIIAVIMVLIVLLVIAIIIKIKMKKDEEELLGLPGAEELDKAMAEHQELTEEETEQQKNLHDEEEKSDIEKAQEYFEEYSRRRGKHF